MIRVHGAGAAPQGGGYTARMPSNATKGNRRAKKAGSSHQPAKPAGKARRATYTAATADKHHLYERAVQSPEAEIQFIDRTFRAIRGRLPDVLREDFCGTAFLACTWVRSRLTNRSIGVDLDKPTLEWAITHNLSWLAPEERTRVELICDDVNGVRAGRADIIAAFNFSYYIFKTRPQLLKYFKAARRGLRKDGLFYLDCYGGYESQDVLTEPRKCAGFTYVWDQAHFNPVTSETLCHIHFSFPDGTKMNKAFTYDWRLWSIAELRELLKEAGFTRSTVYWEGTDPRGEGNGIFRPTTKGEVCAGWVSYIIAER